MDDEVTEKVRQLIHLSSEQGFLTYKDVDKALPKIADKPEELQNVISIFNNLEIKLMDSKDVEKFKKNKEETEEEKAKSNQSDMLDDPVRMYLKQMGKVPLLSKRKKLIFLKGLSLQKLLHLKSSTRFLSPMISSWIFARNYWKEKRGLTRLFWTKNR